jgi:hypothetical protein
LPQIALSFNTARFNSARSICYHCPRADRADIGMEDQAALRRKLAELRTEHRELDESIARLTETAPFDQIQVQRLKKRKLALKDQITRLESKLVPDIIA